VPPLPPARFPDAGATVQTLTSSARPAGCVDILLVNPPSPDGGIWIRSQHRVGRRSRENMIWPQVSLAQLAAVLIPEYSVRVVDCIATRMAGRSSSDCWSNPAEVLPHPGDGANLAQ